MLFTSTLRMLRGCEAAERTLTLRQLLTTGATHLPTSRSNVEEPWDGQTLGTDDRSLTFAQVQSKIHTPTVTSTLDPTAKPRYPERVVLF